MRLVSTLYTTLDGVIEEPGEWSHPFFNEEAGAFKNRELQTSDALLLGRRTYQGFAASWPGMEEETGDFGKKFNSMPKHVASSTLTQEDLTWTNSHLIEGDTIEGVAKLKEQPGRDLVIHGSGKLVHSLARAGLIDEYRFMVHPILVGAGQILFEEGTSTELKLIDTKPLATGIVILTYEPARG